MDESPAEWRRGKYSVSTDPARLDVAGIAEFLATTYWASEANEGLVRRSLKHSLNFGLYCEDKQIGLARVVTDSTMFAFICDVYVLEAFRGLGLGTWLIESVLAHRDLQGLRRWMLATRDAHKFYAAMGFEPLARPEAWMEFLPPELDPVGALTVD